MKRSKQVFNTGEIPHLWAHKVQPSARNAQGNLFFRNGIIFSYGEHFPIARHVTNKAGKAAVLLTTASYSVTTSGHISAVSSAIPPDVPVFHVPDIFADAFAHRSRKEKTTEGHAKNLKAYQTEIEHDLITASRARSSYKREYRHESAVMNRAEYNAYLKFFGLRNKPLAPIPALDSKALDAIRAKEALRVKAETAKQKAEKAARLIELAGMIGEWRGGTLRSIALPHDAPTMLRIIQNEENDATTGRLSYDVETSKGARVPVAHAKRALVLVRAVASRGEAWHTNGHTCHVGHYQIDRIEANGTVKAGCHVIARDEWEAIAPALDAIVLSHDGTEIPQDAMDDYGTQG